MALKPRFNPITTEFEWVERFDPRVESEFVEDWIPTANTGTMIWSAAQSGTGGGASVSAGDATHPGIVTLFAGTDANSGRSARLLGASPYIFGGGVTAVRFNIYFGYLSTAAGTEFIGYMGLGDATTGAEPTDGAYILYDRATSGDYFICVTANSGSRTKMVLDGGGGRATKAVTAGTWFGFYILTDATGANAYFYDSSGNLLATHTTNIPTSAGREFAANFHIWKNGAGTGTGNVTIANDFFWYRKTFTTPR